MIRTKKRVLKQQSQVQLTSWTDWGWEKIVGTEIKWSLVSLQREVRMALDGPDYTTIWHVLLVNTDHYFSNFNIKEKYRDAIEVTTDCFPFFLKNRKDLSILKHLWLYYWWTKLNRLYQYFLPQACFHATPQGGYCLLDVDGVSLRGLLK